MAEFHGLQARSNCAIGSTLLLGLGEFNRANKAHYSRRELPIVVYRYCCLRGAGGTSRQGTSCAARRASHAV
jgi:hypothetical protein